MHLGSINSQYDLSSSPTLERINPRAVDGKGTAHQNASSLGEQDDLGKEGVACDLAAICIKSCCVRADAAQGADINKLSTRCPENGVQVTVCHIRRTGDHSLRINRVRIAIVSACKGAEIAHPGRCVPDKRMNIAATS